MTEIPSPARPARPADADEVARLLDAFNREFDTPTPGADVLAERLRRLLGEPSTFAILAGNPAVGVALVTLRPNVWFAGAVAILDEMYVAAHQRGRGLGSAILTEVLDRCRSLDVSYVEINVDESDVDAQRFYERHGFSGLDPDTAERAFYFSREL